MAYLVGMLLQPTSSGYGTNEFDHAEVKESQTTNTQRVFAALEVLQTFGLPDESRTKLLDSLWRHVISPSWPIREKAAATLCSVLTSNELEDLEIKLLKSNWASNNELHGRILCLRILDSEDGVSDARTPRLAYGTGLLRDVLKEMSTSDEQTEKYKEKEVMWIRWLIVVTGDFRVSTKIRHSTLVPCSPHISIHKILIGDDVGQYQSHWSQHNTGLSPGFTFATIQSHTAFAKTVHLPL